MLLLLLSSLRMLLLQKNAILIANQGRYAVEKQLRKKEAEYPDCWAQVHVDSSEEVQHDQTCLESNAMV